MLHWLQTTAHVCATLPYNRKRKKISINFLHIRILVFRSARKFLFLVPLKNWLRMLAVQPPWILQQYCQFWTFGRVRVQKETRARRIGGTASLTPLAATYCVDLDMRLLLPRQPKREMLTLSDLKATGVIKSVCPTNGRCSAHAYVSSLSLIVSVSSVYYDGVVRTVIWVTGPC